MSIGSLQSNPWTNPWAESITSPSQNGTPWGTDPLSTTGAGQTSSGTSGVTTAPANPFQQLATDIQAMLIQAQATASTTGAGSAASPTGGTTSLTPEQQLAQDMQNLMADLQSGTTQTANSNPTDPVGEASHPHHHHHHHEGGEASGATAVAGSTPSSGTTAAGQPGSQSFAEDITVAIQSFAITA